MGDMQHRMSAVYALIFFARQVYFARKSRIQFLMDLMYKGMLQLLFDFIVVDKLRKILKEK